MRTDLENMAKNEFEWTPNFWQGWRESDNPYRQYKSWRDRLLVSRLLELRDGERVLEVGCGYGWISQALWKSARIEWIGVDRSPEMVSSLLRTAPVAEGRALVADAVRLPFEDCKFDKVLCTGVLMHILDGDLAVRELVRVLRPEGRLVCSINNALSPFSLPVQLWNLRKKGFVQKFRSPKSFRKFLSDCRIELTEIAGDGILATVPISISKFQFPPPSAFPTVLKVDKWATDRFPWLAYEIWFSGVKAR
jgi:SAM-dependent methyltransferase